MKSISKAIKTCLYSVCCFLLLCICTDSVLATQISLSSTNEGGGGNFTGLLLEGSGNPDVGVILMHGREAHPDGAVVRQLRYAFNSAGYTTISIDNPHAFADYDMNGNDRDFSDYIVDVSNENYAFPEAYARVRTAINYLQNLGVKKIVLVGFSMGSRFTAAHVARGQQDELPIVGFIGVGMYANSIDPLNHSTTLDEITVPVLDIYGDDDQNAVTTASARVAAYGGNSGDYSVSVLDCADGLTVNDCHKLIGLKSRNGELCRDLESTAINWLVSNVPLVNPQGHGVCDGGSSLGGDDGGGGAIGYGLVLLLISIKRRSLRKRNIINA